MRCRAPPKRCFVNIYLNAAIRSKQLAIFDAVTVLLISNFRNAYFSCKQFGLLFHPLRKRLQEKIALCNLSGGCRVRRNKLLQHILVYVFNSKHLRDKSISKIQCHINLKPIVFIYYSLNLKFWAIILSDVHWIRHCVILCKFVGQ